jgi:glutathione peroxidase
MSYFCIANDINNENNNDMKRIYDYKALNNKGVEMDFSQYKGQVIMVVNTASKCGFTPQYDGLEALYQKYKDKGLVVIGFPCDQFAHQEPGSDTEIEEFCRLNHGVTFPLMKKTDVNGASEHPVFTYLKEVAPKEEYKGLKAKAAQKMLKTLSKSVEKESDILWNFTKFLINRDSTEIKRYAPTVTPNDIEKDIIEFLK